MELLRDGGGDVGTGGGFEPAGGKLTITHALPSRAIEGPGDTTAEDCGMLSVEEP